MLSAKHDATCFEEFRGMIHVRWKHPNY
uniref:Uncharacterized protein n=1 Tax=Arundo donax TaxID=35708 RepID=A0A0A8YJK9_ARUDO